MNLSVLATSLTLFLSFTATFLFPGFSVDVQPPDPANLLPETVKFRIDPSKSQFMVNVDRAGIFYFKGHSHRIAIRDFDGEATLDLKAIDPAALELNIRAASLEETSDVFTPAQKGIINKELNDLVLETAKYPTISFKSSKVTGKFRNGSYEVRIGGEITLHGVPRHIEIPTVVTVEGETLRAKGAFDLDRKKFKVNATSAFHGTVRVKRTLKFTFDIVARRV